MKKVKSAVWRFFDRIQEENRCVAVMCKLCDNQYKYFGNTTNLRVHMINKHPVQWELSESGNLDETSLQEAVEAAEQEPKSLRKKKYGQRLQKEEVWNETINKNVDVLNQNSDSDVDDATTMNMVRQMHGEENSGEEWLEDPYQITHIETYEPKPKRRKLKYHKIKRELQSPSGLPGYYVAPRADKMMYEEPQSSKDEYSVFGEYVANKLRKLKNPRSIGNLQQLITTLLWQGEYGAYDSADAVKRVLMVSVSDSASEEPASVNNSDIVYEQLDTVVDNSQMSQSHGIQMNTENLKP